MPLTFYMVYFAIINCLVVMYFSTRLIAGS